MLSADDLAIQETQLVMQLREVKRARKVALKAQKSAGAPILAEAIIKAKITLMTLEQASEIATKIASLGAVETLKRLAK
jgi:hypothetical protein